MHRLLADLGISIRHGSEAVRTQWIDNPDRRKKTSERLTQTNHELAAKGLHVRQGKTKANSDLIRGIAEKLKSCSSLLRPDVKAKALQHALATRRLHPERMSALRTPLSKSEEIIRDHLTAIGLPFETRKLLGGYVVDFSFPTSTLSSTARDAIAFHFLTHAIKP